MLARRRPPSTVEVVFDLIETLFVGAAIACALSALHRIAAAIKLGARVEVLEELEDALTVEEREELVQHIKNRALTSW